MARGVCAVKIFAKKKEQMRKKSNLSLYPFPLIVCCGLLVALIMSAGQAKAADQTCAWSVLAGYGTSHPDWGKTKIRVETIDLVLRYDHVLIKDIGSSWYQGYHSLLLELPVHLIVNPDVSPMIGANFLACYTFTAKDQYLPYIFAGGGPLYTNADIPGMGSHWNGNYQFGAGFRYKINIRHEVMFEFRFHHVSNGGQKDPNDPLNSTKCLAGFTF